MRTLSATPLSSAIGAVLLGLSLSASMLPLAVQAREATGLGQVRSWSIPAGELAAVLDIYARQSGVSLSYEAAAVAGKRSAGVSGSYDNRQALDILLSGSGLEVLPQTANSFLLAPKRDSAEVLELSATDITGQRLGEVTEGSGSYTTGLISIGKTPQSLRRTPQSVTVLTEQRLQDQNLTNLTQVLEQTPGIAVNYTDSERVNYYSRGYAIDAVQFDGATVAQSTGNGNFIQPDSALLDHVEVLRGASGMLRGSGNPSGTVNLVRKRPTREAHGSVSATAGRWDAQRYVADISGPLAADGAIRGRMIAVHDDRDLFQDGRSERKSVLYSVLSADLGDSTTLTGGLEYTDLDATGAWGGLPADFDGSPLGLSRDTFLGADWARWDRSNFQMFGDLEHLFDNDWRLKLSASRTRFAYNDRGFYQTFISRASTTNPYLMNMSVTRSDGGSKTAHTNLGAVLDGPFSLLGREHHLTVGAERIKVDSTALQTNFLNNVLTNVDVRNWDPSNIPLPFFTVPNSSTDTVTTQNAVYGSWNISLADPLTAIVGARLNWFDFEQNTTATGDYSVDREVVPYAALIYDLTEQISAYASYSEIFSPQAAYDSSGSLLDPLTGEVYELGLKGEFYEGRLNSSIAVFRTNQVGKALDDPDATGGVQSCPPYYPTGYCKTASGKTRSEGVEIELSGEVLPDWQVGGGYTYTTTEYLKDTLSNTGNPLRTGDPEHMFKLFTSYRLPGAYSAWTVGGGVQAQSDIYERSGAAEARQGGYAVYNAMLGYRVDEHYSLQLNASNLFDRHYYRQVRPTATGYYWGEPRNIALTLRGEF
ncbi:TonB-dependent siderophore receptor [Pseudomonas schmalbachii]|uniref:TonB-dependent siderophore receptor n=1 Tax=Pseudomonas schmalbachii TaxID=2816993 RepID=A0ABS3TWW6_9PSED|nr:TonB-dependent receptor [Pseudomonas schmalbachii]MBO3278157.1 TonB-dependent siderophore receptor [Pseudomonas schmalbachii]